MRQVAILIALGLVLTFFLVVGFGKSDKDLVQGAWIIDWAEMDGSRAPRTNSKIIITADKIFFDEDDKEGKIYKLDPSANPKSMDILAIKAATPAPVGTAGVRPTKPAEPTTKTEVKSLEGIYILEGDTLKVCLGKPHVGRPTEFTSIGDRMLMVLKRAK